MTHREVSSAHFPSLAATLLADHAVVIFTPATSDFPWAADVVWDAARALARAGRQVGLVDLCLDQPVLQRRARGAIDEGIVDALLFGVSLGHVAREQERNLHFIGAGTTPPDAEAVYAHERWRRLGRGFKQESALLLLFVPPSALGRLQADVDGLVVLSPGGYAEGTPTFPGIGERIAAGVPLVAVVRQGSVSGQVASVVAPRASAGRVALGRPRHRSRRPVVAGLVLGVVAIGGLAVLAFYPRARPLPPRAAPPAPSSRTGAAAITAAAAPASAPSSAKAEAGDSLFYSVQVAAYNQPDQAAADATRLARTGTGPVTVSPVHLGAQGMWYRVMVGVLPTPAGADSLLRWLWNQRLVEQPNGTILRTPHANALAESASPAEAERLVQGLRRRGIAAYIVPAPGGLTRVLAGAFEEPDQARAADSLLQLAGLKSTLVLRTGIRP
jgi:cell division septation protein DedD